MEHGGDTEKAGLCPHGKLPGICAECLSTREGQDRKKEIEESARLIGSEIAKELERETGIKPFDVVMVLGAGFSKRRERKKENVDGQPMNPENYRPGWMLNAESRMRLNAAAQLYYEGRTRLICVTGGRAISEQWKDYPSLAELGKRYLIEKFHIPEKDIIMEDQSDATHGNLAHGLREIYKQNIPIGEFAILSSGYHLRRAAKMAEESGIRVSLIPAEEQLLRRSHHYERFIQNWLDIKRQQVLEDNETAKLKDEEYWRDRSAVFTTPLDEPVPGVDISRSVAETAKRLTGSGIEGIQTDSF